VRIQDVPVDPGQVSAEVREVLSRPEFRYEPSLAERIGDWIAERLEWLTGRLGVPGGGTFGGGAGSVVAWILVVAAAAILVAVVVYAVRNRVRRPRAEAPALQTEIEQRRPAAEWAAEAERLEADRRWKEALLARYRELIRSMVDLRQVPDVAGRTTGELRTDVASSSPSASHAFETATRLFELSWYAGRPTGAAENAEFRTAAAQVTAAPVVHPVVHSVAQPFDRPTNVMAPGSGR
jgi:hypothetical protein